EQVQAGMEAAQALGLAWGRSCADRQTKNLRHPWAWRKGVGLHHVPDQLYPALCAKLLHEARAGGRRHTGAAGVKIRAAGSFGKCPGNCVIAVTHGLWTASRQ